MNALAKYAAITLLLLFSNALRAEEAFYRIALDKLAITSGALPVTDDTSPRQWDFKAVIHPYVVLDGNGEAYLAGPKSDMPDARFFAGGMFDPPLALTELVVSTPAAAEKITGTMFLRTPDATGLTPVKFTLPAAHVSTDARNTFYRAKFSYYARLQESGNPGTAWFRFQAAQALSQWHLTEKPNEPAWRGTWRDDIELTTTYDLFSGGQALSESLQPDRDLGPPGQRPATRDD